MRKEKEENWGGGGGGETTTKTALDEESRIPVFHKNQSIKEKEKEKKALQTDYSQQEAIGLITAASNTGP